MKEKEISFRVPSKRRRR